MFKTIYIFGNNRHKTRINKIIVQKITGGTIAKDQNFPIFFSTLPQNNKQDKAIAPNIKKALNSTIRFLSIFNPS